MLGKGDLILKYKELISNYCTGADFKKLEIRENLLRSKIYFSPVQVYM